MLFRNLSRVRGHAVWTPSLHTGSIVVDAGAHRGEFANEIHTRFGSRCILVEANPKLAAILCPPPGGQVIYAAIAASDGLAQFVFRENPEGGGIIVNVGDEDASTSLVEMLSLESLMLKAGIQRIDLLKLDIEGAEFPLLDQTPDQILANIGQITVEFHDFIPDFRGRRLYEAARDRLIAVGFAALPMAFRTHGDVLFLNRRLFGLSKAKLALLSHGGRWVLKFRESRGNP